MKKICTLPILILTLFFSSCISQNVKKDITKNLKIKSCEVYTYAASGNFDDTKNKTFFDEDGNKLKTITINSDGTIRDICNFIYDKGLLIEKGIYESDGQTLDSKDIYIYENGNMIELKHYTVTDKGDLYHLGSNKFRYDKEGRKIEENKGIMLKYLYKYENDKLLERTSYFYGTIPDTTIHIYKYDEVGNLIQDISKSTAGEINLNTIFKYDEHNRLILEETYNNTGKITSQYKMKYDEYGNIKEKIEFYFRSTKKVIINYSYEFYN